LEFIDEEVVQNSRRPAVQAQARSDISIMHIMEMGVRTAVEKFWKESILFHLSFKM
jgi:hypothetical protein